MKECKTIIEILDSINNVKIYKKRNRAKYFNNRFAFDIETSSFYINGLSKKPIKQACCYAYIFGIDGNYKIGRSLDEFIKDLNEVLFYFRKRSLEARIVIYIHNLSYEFQFIRKYFKFVEILANDERKPIYAVTDNGIEFRCSYMLSGFSLKKVGENLTKHTARKMVGDLDYNLLRGSTTPLTEKELGYIREDYEVLDNYIEETIDEYKYISKIPYTKTGKVRQFCRKICNEKGQFFKKYIKDLVITSVEEYMLMRRAFAGGFTHANPLACNNLIKDVTSVDFISSYPAVMVSEMFPMSSGEIYNAETIEDIKNLEKEYVFIFDITFYDIEDIFLYDNFLSASHCVINGKKDINNGRVVKAQEVKTTITNIDLQIITKTYKWTNYKIGKCYRYKKFYLPTPFVKAILLLYEKKTTLKGVDGKEQEYQNSKEMLNSCFGMTVTDIIRDLVTYNDEWLTQKNDLNDIAKLIDKYNKSTSRFLFYTWGVFITSYARRNLWGGILEFKSDYCYSDTDSIKAINFLKHQSYIDKYNENCYNKIKLAMSYHKLPIEMAIPSTIKGIKKPLGYWDYDGHYDYFKTLGAKRYMTYSKDKGLSLTISGVNKGVAVPYLLDVYKNNIDKIFESFTDGLEFPAPHAGKQVLTYIDFETSGEFIDYLGEKQYYHDLSSIHMEEGSYNLSMGDDYLLYLYVAQCRLRYE